MAFSPFEDEKPPLLAEVGFFALLLLLFVTLHPFSAADKSPLVVSAVEPVASDIWRQISFTGVTLAIVTAAAMWRPALFLRVMPVSMGILLGWCLLSATWADAPLVVFRRAVLITEVTFSVLLGTTMLGPERAFARLRLVLMIVLAVNWLSIPLFPVAAIHQPGETDPSLVGDWRGIYHQKNTAGLVCAMTVLVFFFPGARPRRTNDWWVILAAAAFLIMTRSKTCIALLPVALIFGMAYRRGWKNGLNRALLAMVALLALGCIVALLLLNTEAVIKYLGDPANFTGRTEIWQADFAFIRNHFLLGSGFQAVFGTGGQSPLAPYLPAGGNWVAEASDSHNGYIDVFLGIGAIGFALAMLAVVVRPFMRFWPLNFQPARDGYFALFVFVIFHSFTEADYLAADGEAWLVFLMLLAAIRQPVPAPAPAPTRTRPAGALSWQARA